MVTHSSSERTFSFSVLCTETVFFFPGIAELTIPFVSQVGQSEEFSLHPFWEQLQQAICYPKHAVEITQTNYQRLKVFVNEQRSKYNQKQTEKAAKEELNLRAEETQVLEDQASPTVEVTKEEAGESQTEVSDVQEKPTEMLAEVTPQSSFWSKIPFVDNLTGGKTSATGDVSPLQDTSDDKAATEVENSKDRVIVQEDSASGDVKAEGDIGQSNPEDKDMYSTRS